MLITRRPHAQWPSWLMTVPLSRINKSQKSVRIAGSLPLAGRLHVLVPASDRRRAAPEIPWDPRDHRRRGQPATPPAPAQDQVLCQCRYGIVRKWTAPTHRGCEYTRAVTVDAAADLRGKELNKEGSLFGI